MQKLLFTISTLSFIHVRITTWKTFNRIKDLFRRPDMSIARDGDGITDWMWCGGVPFTKFGFVILLGEDAFRDNKGERIAFSHDYVDE